MGEKATAMTRPIRQVVWRVSQTKVGWGRARKQLGTNSPCTAERSAAGDNARQRGSGFPREAGDQNEVAFHGKCMD